MTFCRVETACTAITPFRARGRRPRARNQPAAFPGGPSKGSQVPAARCGERGRRVDGQAFDPLALKAKLTCADALLERGRRFAVARRAREIVRLAILRIGRGRRDEVRHKVAEGRSLLKSYLGRN